MPDVAIVPVRSFRLGKQRLREWLPDDERERLGRRLATHVTEVSAQAGVVPLIVSRDPDVESWSIESGYPTIADPGTGLDDAARVGVDWAEQTKSRWLVLHSDLPALTASDVSDMFDALDSAPSVIAPSSDGGTSALASLAPLDFAYGPASFHRHLPRLHDPVVCVSPGLLFDLDSGEDLEAAARYVR